MNLIRKGRGRPFLGLILPLALLHASVAYAQCTCPTPNGACLASSPASVLADFCEYPATGCGSTASQFFQIGGGPCCRPPGSPIIIDIDGSGYHLTSAEHGVQFDFFDTDRPVKIAWTARGSTNAFLVRDLYGDGKIVDGAEMFGNLTQQPPSANPNGFAALAQYDANHDGWIDANDPIWTSLLLWIDANHNGISEPGELHSLDSLGVTRISVNYTTAGRTDPFGNVFRYRARVNDDGPRLAYDVFLTYLF